MTDTQIEKIQKYLSDEMNHEEQKAFQQELNADKNLLAAFNTYLTVEIHMRNNKKYAGEDTLKNTLTELGNAFFNTESGNDSTSQTEQQRVTNHVPSGNLPNKTSQVNNRQVWKLAAAIFLGIAVTATWYIVTNKNKVKDPIAIQPKTSIDSIASHRNSIDTGILSYPSSPPIAKGDTGSNREPNPSENAQGKLLAEKYFEPDTAPVDQEGPLEEAFEQYEKRRFASAAAAFEDADLIATTRSEADDTLLTKFYAAYYQALSYMAIQKDAKAIPLLKDLNGPSRLLQVKVRWYLALAYLRTGNTPKAISALGAIATNNGAGEYRVNTQKLLKELNKKEGFLGF